MTPLPTTREACDELIAQITKHRDSLPTHPIVGHLYRHECGLVYIAADTDPVKLIKIDNGSRWSSKGGFGDNAQYFTHLGPAADHLMLKSDAPKLPEVTDEIAARAWKAFYCCDEPSLRHILTLYREGKL